MKAHAAVLGAFLLLLGCSPLSPQEPAETATAPTQNAEPSYCTGIVEGATLGGPLLIGSVSPGQRYVFEACYLSEADRDAQAGTGVLRLVDWRQKTLLREEYFFLDERSGLPVLAWKTHNTGTPTVLFANGVRQVEWPVPESESDDRI